MAVTRVWQEGRMGDSMFNRFTVSAWGDEKVLEMGDGGGCTTM